MSQILTVDESGEQYPDFSELPAFYQSMINFYQLPAAALVYPAEKIKKNVEVFKYLLADFLGEV